ASPSSRTSGTRTATSPADTPSTPASCRIRCTSSLDPGRLLTTLRSREDVSMDARDEALLQVGIAAALADGVCDERERGHLDALARAAGADSSASLAQSASLRPDLAERLGTPEARQAAYDLALAVCHADGVTNEAETTFLTTLRSVLRLSDTSVAQDARTA